MLATVRLQGSELLPMTFGAKKTGGRLQAALAFLVLLFASRAVAFSLGLLQRQAQGIYKRDEMFRAA